MKTLPPIRQSDCHGHGHFGAPRAGGKRKHNGVDFACYPGAVVLSAVKGVVTKLGFPYADDLSFRYVQITDEKGKNVRYFYVEPCVAIGQKISVLDPIGMTQKLGDRYVGITEHFHLEIMDGPNYIDPLKYLKGELDGTIDTSA